MAHHRAFHSRLGSELYSDRWSYSDRRRSSRTLHGGKRSLVQSEKRRVSGRHDYLVCIFLQATLKTRFFAAAGVAGALAVTAAVVSRSTAKTERENPPKGKFVDVDGFKLHYLERGEGPAVVLLHGNAVSAEDWESSGVLGALAAGHRVIAFDRPGFGYSARPRRHSWTAKNQAELIGAALVQLEISKPIVVGHSWGTLVALELALSHPEMVDRLVLLSGYYFASVRIDALLQLPLTIPLLGDILRYTTAPVAGVLMTNMIVRKMFAPSAVSDRFWRLPWAMSLRPSQLRASAEDAVAMVPAAARLQERYGELSLPVDIVAGRGDKIADPNAQSARFAKLLNCNLGVIDGSGHMVHYFASNSVVSTIGRSQAATIQEPVTIR